MIPIIKYLSVFFVGMFKFFIAPFTGFGLGLGFLETYICTVAGMMLSVVLFAYLGKYAKNKLSKMFSKKRKLFSPYNRRLVQIWQKYGMWGVALLTPILFSPIVGTLIASSFGESPLRIIYYMFISASFWGMVLLSALHGFSQYFF